MNNKTKIALSLPEFIWKNTLNIYEYGTNIGYKILIDVIFERKIRSFGTNPVAANVIRDISGFPSVLTHAWNNVHIGNTETITDIGFILFSATKITCKASLIVSYVYFIDPEAFNEAGKLDLVGRVGNYICDPLGGIWRQASIERQEEKKTDINFFSYFYENFKFTWVSKAVIGGIPKVLISDIIGEGFKRFISYRTDTEVEKSVLEFSPFHYIDNSNPNSLKTWNFMSYKNYVGYLTNKVDIMTKNFFLKDNNVQITVNDDIWSKFENIFDSQNWKSYPTFGIIAITTVIGKLIEDIVPAFTLATTSRCTQSYIESCVEDFLNNQTYHNGTNIYSDPSNEL